MGVDFAASITKTFMDVFHNALLWIDPKSTTGILLGQKSASPSIGSAWPGFERTHLPRSLSEEQVRQSVLLQGDALAAYAADGEIITDDNQLLAYGAAVYQAQRASRAQEDNIARLEGFNPLLRQYSDRLHREAAATRKKRESLRDQ
jgi:hypothetical protein